MDAICVSPIDSSFESINQTLVGRALIGEPTTISKDLASIGFSPTGISFIFGYAIESFGGTSLTTSDLNYFGKTDVGDINSLSFSYGEPRTSFIAFGVVSISGSKIIVSRSMSTSSFGGIILAFLIYGHFKSK